MPLKTMAAHATRMNFGARIGRFWWYRQKGALYLEVVRQWILPVMGASAASKYLGFSLTQSIIFWVCLAVVAESAAVLIGWLERRSGATSANYGLAKETDPFKIDALAHAKRTADEVRLIRLVLAALLRRLEPTKPQ